MRNMLFVSHANPEDNEFALWLALQLAREGYPVWCDLTKLLGGEDFWKNIEQAIRDRAAKFLYVLSKVSNAKDGPLQELKLANDVKRNENLNDFVIPLLRDDLPHNQFNILLTRLNAVPFNKGWAEGLKILLEKLENDKVQRDPRFTPNAVTAWWKEQFGAEKGVLFQPEEYLSNWFPIQTFPQNIYFHKIERLHKDSILFPYPAFRHGQYLISFASAQDINEKSQNLIRLGDSRFFPTNDFLNGRIDKNIVDTKHSQKLPSRLLGMTWGKMILERKLPIYDLANRVRIFYFTGGLAKNNRAYFTGMDGKRSYRDVVGYKSRKNEKGEIVSKRFWHFGIQAKPLIHPFLTYIVKPHVVFSDDGSQIWESKERLHRARRSQCKNWWNPQWRDRILGTMSWLAYDAEQVRIEVGSDSTLQILSHPLVFKSPVSYIDPEKGSTLIIEESRKDERDAFDDFESEDEE